MPTSATTTFNNNVLEPVYPSDQVPAPSIAVTIAASQTIAKGTVVGQVTADGTYKAYASGSSDGSQIPKGITQRAVATDASGNITFGTATGGGLWGETSLTCPIFIGGSFQTSELTGLDANAVTKLGGTFVTGNGTSGVFVF